MSSLRNSPFSNKIDSYFVPKAGEVAEIRQLLVGAAIQLETLDSQLEEMEAAVVRVREQREALHLDMVAHQSLLSPIRPLPPDILREIFLACLPTANHPIIHPAYAPLLLSSVCHYWRELSRSTPALWKKVHILALHDTSFIKVDRSAEDSDILRQPPPRVRLPTFTPDPATLTGFLRTVDQWIGFVSACPLSISYSQGRHFPDAADPDRPVDPASLEIFDRLLASRSQIETFFARRLMVDIHDDDQPFERLRILDTAEELTLSGYFVPLELRVTWNHLTKLVLRSFRTFEHDRNGPSPDSGMDQNAVFEILRRCPRLVQSELAISVYVPRKPTDVSVLMAHLEHLVLSLGYFFGNRDVAPDVAGLLQALTMPKLSTFHLSTSFQDVLCDDHVLTRPPGELSVHFHPDLHHRGAEFEFVQILEILAEFPQTTSLHFSSLGFNDRPAHEVSPLNAVVFAGLQTQGLCPVLKHLHVALVTTYHIDAGPRHPGLLDFVRSRRPVLESLHLNSRGSLALDDAELWRSKRSENKMTRAGVKSDILAGAGEIWEVCPAALARARAETICWLRGQVSVGTDIQSKSDGSHDPFEELSSLAVLH
uniref:F-box domain-containing protein n=1 Tax=Mycena chlorophos TaxID=658473 RepID=A0ABQ0L9A8_MYCCL|nr:predicted protein [Mycena chlorophos]